MNALPTNSSEMETARLQAVFQEMHDPAEIRGLNLAGMSAAAIQALLPQYDASASNPTFGILVEAGTGKSYAFQSGRNYGVTVHEKIEFRRGLFSSVEIENSTANFINLEAHIEA